MSSALYEYRRRYNYFHQYEINLKKISIKQVEMSCIVAYLGYI